MAKKEDPQNPFIKKIARFYLRFCGLILVLTLALAYGAFSKITQLKIDTNIHALMPENIPSIQ
ncbi:MAG: hypothetical protein IIC07_03235, partial [Proteobacteria bacterium]|nr:hypothetical protein [Pseudomonadota bacterium]